METIYVVRAEWRESWHAENIKAFKSKSDAEAFAIECYEYDKTKPDDDNLDWFLNHPSSPFWLAESYDVVEWELF